MTPKRPFRPCRHSPWIAFQLPQQRQLRLLEPFPAELWAALQLTTVGQQHQLYSAQFSAASWEPARCHQWPFLPQMARRLPLLRPSGKHRRWRQQTSPPCPPQLSCKTRSATVRRTSRSGSTSTWTPSQPCPSQWADKACSTTARTPASYLPSSRNGHGRSGYVPHPCCCLSNGAPSSSHRQFGDRLAHVHGKAGYHLPPAPLQCPPSLSSTNSHSTTGDRSVATASARRASTP